MAGSQSENNTGHIGEQFRACPSCGELAFGKTPYCRFCGASLQEHSSDTCVSEPLISLSSPRNAASEPVQSVPPAAVSPDVVIEPPPANPDSFSWTAFFFADLWYADKGLPQKSLKHFAIRLPTVCLGVTALILAVSGSTKEEAGIANSDLVAASVFFVFWLLLMLVSATVSYLDAGRALRELSAVRSTLSEPAIKQQQQTGTTYFWTMLYVPFLLYVLVFLMVLQTFEHSKPHIRLLEKGGRFLLEFLRTLFF